jgi:hypothetical protein
MAVRNADLNLIVAPFDEHGEISVAGNGEDKPPASSLPIR